MCREREEEKKSNKTLHVCLMTEYIIIIIIHDYIDYYRGHITPNSVSAWRGEERLVRVRSQGSRKVMGKEMASEKGGWTTVLK